VDKEQLKEMLVELFEEGAIRVNTDYSNVIIVEIDGSPVQIIEL
jgi:hypothetical protein